MDDDDEAAALAHQQDMEALEARCRKLAAEQKVLDAQFEQGTKRFWDSILLPTLTGTRK